MTGRTTTQIITIFIAVLLVDIHAAPASGPIIERSDWQQYFDQHEATGTIVISDDRQGLGQTYVFNPPRANKRYNPASTFKIPHALFVLDAGIIKSATETIPWDKKERTYGPWNRDQTLSSAISNSTVWVFEKFANELGSEQEKSYLKKIRYGNQDPSGKSPFWIKGNLQITALEQIEFLKQLHGNKLPFQPEHQELIKDIITIERTDNSLLRAKTGWSGEIGWWIGWLEQPSGPIFFALNINTPNRAKDLPKREAVVRSVLNFFLKK